MASAPVVYKLGKDKATHITVTDGGWFDADGNQITGARLQKAAVYVGEQGIKPELVTPPAPATTSYAEGLGQMAAPQTPVDKPLVRPNEGRKPSPREMQITHKRGDLSYFTHAENKRNELINLREEAKARLQRATDLYHSAQPGGIAPRSVHSSVGFSEPAAWPDAVKTSPLLRDDYSAFAKAHGDLQEFDSNNPDLLQMINPESGYPDEFEGRLGDADANYRRAQWEASKKAQ